MSRLKKREELEKSFPDEKLTNSQLGRFKDAVKKAGGKQAYLIKKKAIKISEDGSISVAYVEGLNGQEVMPGTGLRYRSNTPLEFWERAFAQLDRLEYGLNKGKKQLEVFADSFKPDKRIS